MDEKEEMPPKSNNDDEEEEIVEYVEFVYDSEDKKITDEIKRTMTKLIVRGPNVKTIGKGVFKECAKLKEVDFTEAIALETIGDSAFRKCPSLLAFKCPSNVKTIGVDAFEECENLREIDFTEAIALETIGEFAFYNCPSLLAFKCPSDVKTIKEGVFAYCAKLKEIDFTEATALETIGKQAFYRCPSLLAFKCPSNVKTIGEYAFRGCAKLKEIDFTEATALETIGEQAFYDCPSLLAFKCPSNVKTIGKEAFQQCENLKEIDFTKATALETIGEGAFYECTSLENVYFAPNVTVVPKNILEDCPNLQFLKIPSGNPAIHIRLYTSLNEDEKHLITLNDIVNVYACNPIKNSELLENSGDEKSILHQVRAMYIGSIVDGTRRLLSIPERNGWLQFLANNMGDGTDDPDMSKLLDYLETVDIERVRQLAETKDQSERTAKSVASKHIQEVFEDRLFFLGRYDIARGPPIHQSATCVVVKATDAKMREYFEAEYKPYEGREVDEELFQEILGKLKLIPHDKKNIKGLFQRADVDRTKKISKEEFVDFCLAEIGGNVVLKLMQNKDQFCREVERREQNNLDSKYVVGSIGNHDLVQASGKDTANQTFREKVGVSAENYSNVLVMPYGDRNLDTIFRSERPTPITVRHLMKQVGEALQHLHKMKIIHGDIKMLNVVRITHLLELIDLDASTKIGDSAGSKFSSGVLPPEMTCKLNTREELEMFERYVQNGTASDDEKQKRKVLVTTGQDKQYFVVRSFWEEEQTVETTDKFEGKDKVEKKLMPMNMNGLPYGLVEADASLDVWSFGVLLFELVTKEPLFKVNNENDITDGDVMRQLHNWTDEDMKIILNRKVTDKYAREVLQHMLCREPTDRWTMEKLLELDYFKPEHVQAANELMKRIETTTARTETTVARTETIAARTETIALENREIIKTNFDQIHKALKSVLSHQKVANSLLKSIFQGMDKSQPKHFVILPPAEQGKDKNAFSGFLSKIKNTSIFNTKARLCFICPISLQPVVGTDGEAIGYEIKLPQGWIKEYGPAILIGLKIFQVGFAVGRGFGLPLPSLSGAEEGLKEASSLFSEMQGLLVDGMGGDDKEDSLADMLLERFTDEIDTAASGEGPPTAEMGTKHRARLQKSYQGIGTLIKDEEFKRCGLVKGMSDVGEEIEYVHPDVEPLFKKFGSKCLGMPFEEREKENAKLAAEARSEKEKQVVTRSPANGEDEKAKGGTLVSSVTAPPPPPSGSPIKLMAEHPRDEVNLSEEQGRQIMVKSAPSSTNSDSEAVARLEEKLTKLEGKMDSSSEPRFQGMAQGSGHVVRKGWLRIQSRWPPYLWKERYVEVYKNGSITHYPNRGSTFSSVKWIDMEDGATMELRSAKNKVIATAKLSTRCSSTIDDWCHSSKTNEGSGRNVETSSG